MPKRMISFIIPAYNEEKFIGNCLQSIIDDLNGKSIDSEIIVVNNASTDRTKEISRKYPGVIVIDEPRKGLSRARHMGFLHSRGDLVANLDADTTLPPGWIDKVCAEFSKNPELVALSGPFIYHDLPKIKRFFATLFFAFSFLIYLINKHILRMGSLLQGGNFIIRRNALEKI